MEKIIVKLLQRAIKFLQRLENKLSPKKLYIKCEVDMKGLQQLASQFQNLSKNFGRDLC